MFFEILVVNNNSRDNTKEILKETIEKNKTKNIKVVEEFSQGIVFARNRAIEESLQSDYLIFIDDDELPHPGYLQAAIDTFKKYPVDVVGGRINVNFENHVRPEWLSDDLLKPLAAIDYGDKAFMITDSSTPLWTSNIAYKTKIFKNGLRFDKNYNREGYNVGGGEDEVMFRKFLELGIPVMYQPAMVADHFVEPWRLKRGYFYRLNYTLGYKEGRYATEIRRNTTFGVPKYIYRQMFSTLLNTAISIICFDKKWFKRSLIAVYFCGCIYGCYCSKRSRE